METHLNLCLAELFLSWEKVQRKEKKILYHIRFTPNVVLFTEQL
jgi:hypothetical protein